MLSLAAGLGGQLRRGYRAGCSVSAVPSAEGLRAVVVCGMGGSGVGGDVLRSLFSGTLPVPLVVVKGYSVPAFCDGDTLVLASSFSGHTEETVAAYRQAVAKGCRVLTFSGGGELAALSEADQVPHVRLPDDVSMPRAALGYLAGAPIGVLDTMGLIPPASEGIESAALLLEGLAARLGPGIGSEANEAKALAAWIGDRVPVVWGSEGLAETAAVRWKTQVNENAKGPAWAAVLPELDHNEVEGWTDGTGSGFAAIVLRHPGEHPKTARRVEATIEAVAPSGLEVREVKASGDGPMDWLFSLVMLGDFATTYLAVARGQDPMPIPVLTGLKRRLSE
jgi:glucose/mannose-6-phosphate isomerase